MMNDECDLHLHMIMMGVVFFHLFCDHECNPHDDDQFEIRYDPS